MTLHEAIAKLDEVGEKLVARDDPELYEWFEELQEVRSTMEFLRRDLVNAVGVPKS